MLARLMPLLTLADAELAYGLHPLLDRANLSVRSGERIGLIGRNGTGKSTLLRVIAGQLALDGGELRRRDGLRIAVVEREVAGNHPEQRGLAGAVAPDEADALAAAHDKRGAVEQRVQPVGEFGIGEGDQGHAAREHRTPCARATNGGGE